MLATLRSNISDLLRRPLDIIVIGGLGMMVLLCMISDVITWPLLPANRSELIAPWESTDGPLNISYVSFEDQSVIVRIACETYPVRITGSEIVYLDGRPSQSYRFGRPLSSLVIQVDRPPQLIIITPGPIPVGVYTHQVFTWTSGPHP
jgi:hypothetical protein